MSLLNRRDAIKFLLGGLLQTAGSVVVASSVLPARAAQGETSDAGAGSAKDFAQRADQVADAQGSVLSEEDPFLNLFVNGAFRNTGYGGGAFRNAGFANGGYRGGDFRNGGFGNGGGGGGAFRNGGFANGGWRNY
jgi:hypothetical protein